MLFKIILIGFSFLAGVVLTIVWGRLRARSGVKKNVNAQTLERYRRSQEFARIGTWEWTLQNNVLFWSDEIYAMFGYRLGEVTPSYELFCNALHPEDREGVLRAEEDCLNKQGRYDMEYRVIWPDGTVRWVHESGDVLFDAEGKAESFSGIIRDVTTYRKKSEHIHQLAHFDILTGLPNRVSFTKQLQQAIERSKRQGTMVALVYMDLNNFKPINDGHGHGVGDNVLRAVADRLVRSFRSVDMVARVGGDEFIAILEGLKSAEEVQRIVEKLQRQFAKPFALDKRFHDVGISAGISLYPDDSTDIDELVNLADAAMYKAKKSVSNVYDLADGKRTKDQADL